MSSSTSPRSPSRTAAPFLYETIRRRNSVAFDIWPVAWIVSVLSRPYSTPVGSITLLLRICAATWLTPIPRLASLDGSSCTRTAYFAEPNTFTCATPSIIDKRCAMVVSAYSSISWTDSSLDVSVILMIGPDDGFCLR